MSRINVTRSSMPDFTEYCEEIKGLWESRWLTNMGEKHNTLQAMLENKLGADHVALFSNGHLALEAVLRAMGLKGEVITTPFTFASTTNAIIRCGLTPVFCDVKSDDFTMDPQKIEALITDKTCAIMPVHVYGNLCDDEAISAIAKKHGLKLIYDAAHAFGVEKDGVKSGEMGDVSMYSFHATKVFNTIEGGALAYRDEELGRNLQLERNFGIMGPEDVVIPGGNAKMNEFQAAMGICNLRHLDGEIALRCEADAAYRRRLQGIEGIRLNPLKEGVKHNYAYFPVVFDGWKKDRDQVFLRLQEEDITARKYFYPATNAFPFVESDPALTPVAMKCAQQVLCLPLYAGLTAEEIDRICDIILG